MTRITYVIREMGRNLYRNFGTAVGSLLSLTLLFLLFDLFWVAAGTSERFYLAIISDLQMDVFIREDLAEEDVPRLADSLEQLPGVSSVTYISRERARLELADQVGTDLLVGYDTLNPLPRSLVLTFQPSYLNLSDMRRLEARLAPMLGVAEISYSRQWLEKVEQTRSILLKVGLALGLIIFLTALISSANSIRLMTRARAVGFRQLLLLGTGRLFIALPFLVEGFLMAVLAAAIGWGIVYYGNQQVSFSQVEIVIPVRDQIIAFCLGCGLIGLVSGYLGVRGQLKARE